MAAVATSANVAEVTVEDEVLSTTSSTSTQALDHFISDLVDDLNHMLKEWKDDDPSEGLGVEEPVMLEETQHATQCHETLPAASSTDAQGHKRTPSAMWSSLQALVQLQKDVFLKPSRPGDEDLDDSVPATPLDDEADPYMAALPTSKVATSVTKEKNIALVDDRPESFDNQLEVLLNMASWYRPDCKRWDVAKLLEKSKDGTFLIRPSASYDGNLVLCLRFNGIILHFLLDRYAHQSSSVSSKFIIQRANLYLGKTRNGSLLYRRLSRNCNAT